MCRRPVNGFYQNHDDAMGVELFSAFRATAEIACIAPIAQNETSADRPDPINVETEQLPQVIGQVSTTRVSTDQNSGSSTEELEIIEEVAPPKKRKVRKQARQRRAVVKKVRVDKGQQQVTTVTSNDADKWYVVEKVVGMETFRQGHKSFNRYLIKWKNYPESENTYEHESDLDNCIDLVNEFRATRKLAPLRRKRPQRGGASSTMSDDAVDPSKWLLPERVVQATSWFKRLYHQRKNSKNVEIKEFTGFSETDTVYIVLEGSHFFVLVHLAKKNLGYIADGANEFIRNDEYRVILQDRLKIELRPIKVKMHNKMNCCGAEAALIALKLGKLYCGDHLESLQLLDLKNDNVYARLKKLLYKGLAQNPHYDTGKAIQSLVCPHCGRGFRCNNRMAFGAHTRKCKDFKNHQGLFNEN